MVRGCEKRIYHVKNPESELFDEAYFILRRGGRSSKATPREIELEAMRIVRDSDKGGGRGEKKENLRAFVCGAVLSAFIIGMAAALVWILC